MLLRRQKTIATDSKHPRRCCETKRLVLIQERHVLFKILEVESSDTDVPHQKTCRWVWRRQPNKEGLITAIRNVGKRVRLFVDRLDLKVLNPTRDPFHVDADASSAISDGGPDFMAGMSCSNDRSRFLQLWCAHQSPLNVQDFVNLIIGTSTRCFCAKRQ